jgi:pyrimidine operon attenuation protein/uracil phosphoribosyltransferase
MANRYICDVLEAMRECDKTHNYSYLIGLVEEAQYLATRMESSLYDKNNYKVLHKEIKILRKRKSKLEKEVEKLKEKRKK